LRSPFNQERNMKFSFQVIIVIALLSPTLLYAEGDMAQQAAIIKKISLGNKTNALRFYPNTLEFKTGQLYKLIIHNPSKQKHYSTSVSFSRAIFTRKIQIMSNRNTTLAEVKGQINEVEVYPGGTTAWWFVPIKTLNNSNLHCSIKGHTEAGMLGTITIK